MIICLRKKKKHLKPSIPLLLLACSFHSSKGRNFVLLQKLQPISSRAPSHISSGQGLQSARTPSHPPRSYEDPDEHNSINITWEATPVQMRGDKELREEDTELLLHMGLSCLCPRGDGEREKFWRTETLRKLFPPCRWKGKLEAKPWVHWVILSSSAFPACHPGSIWQNITLLGAGDAHGPHQQICAQNSCRSGLLLPVETRTRLNVESYKFLQQHASLQHVARNVAVAMVKNSCLVKSVKSCIIS